MRYAVQGMEEGGQRLEPAGTRAGRLAEPQFVEQPHRPAAQQTVRQDVGRGGQAGGAERQGVPTRARAAAQCLQGRVVAAGEDRAARRAAAGEQVDPGDRVGVVVIGGRDAGHQVVEVVGALGVDQHPGRLDRLEPQRRRQDDAGEAHAARRRVEQRRVLADGLDAAVGGEEFQGRYVAAEGARDVVVLSVDVRTDRAADRDVPRTGRHGHEPAEGQQYLHQPVQGDARVAQDGPAGDVDRVDPVQARHVQHRPAGVLRRVPVRPSQAPRDAAASPAVPDGRHGLLVGARADQPGGGGGGAAPPREGCERGAGRGVGDGVGRHGGDRNALCSALILKHPPAPRNG
ncbi:hypothetical protein GCM10010254_59300 [Streptomyces chromofuscus]|nr:hypothetical protein GCM10010254_59300 [Streptomyces chromofuscus]